MKTIWKINIPIHDKIVTYLPKDAQFNFLAIQGGYIRAWFEVDMDASDEQRRFSIVGTGNPIPDGYRHLSSVISPPFVWHLYEEKKEAQ